MAVSRVAIAGGFEYRRGPHAHILRLQAPAVAERAANVRGSRARSTGRRLPELSGISTRVGTSTGTFRSGITHGPPALPAAVGSGLSVMHRFRAQSCQFLVKIYYIKQYRCQSCD